MVSKIDFATAEVLITGGSDGIGLALAERFLTTGARVLVTGRNLSKLQAAKQRYPKLEISVSDASQPEDREALVQHVIATLPRLNVVINNAGVQRRIGLASDHAEWKERQAEIDTNLSGPIHLNHLLIPHILKHRSPAVIINVSSGGAFIPQVFAPIYAATKAAIHSYTMTLRSALADTPIRVVELIPPAVQTSLSGGQKHGLALNAFTDEVFEKILAQNAAWIGAGPTAGPEVKAIIESANAMFDAMAGRFPTEKY